MLNTVKVLAVSATVPAMDSSLAIFLTVLVLTSFANSGPVPDSAGVVPLMDGLAYGGIPYGSVSGQLSDYFGPYRPIVPKRRKTDLDEDTLQHL
ncbi:UNVERIFIED_CONTAM: hypothetical protein PYX00_008973 [Menopon gallinae]|uniref:Uncharacterized protein n=1 Tax=Menopon gallinae TaxID=328185 RepID=A0AAW2HA60_9NEOP